MENLHFLNNNWPSKSGDFYYLLDILDSLAVSWPFIQFLLSISHQFAAKIFLTQRRNTGNSSVIHTTSFESNCATHESLIKRKIQFSYVRWNSDYNNADAKLSGPGYNVVLFITDYMQTISYSILVRTSMPMMIQSVIFAISLTWMAVKGCNRTKKSSNALVP